MESFIYFGAFNIKHRRPRRMEGFKNGPKFVQIIKMFDTLLKICGFPKPQKTWTFLGVPFCTKISDDMGEVKSEKNKFNNGQC